MRLGRSLSIALVGLFQSGLWGCGSDNATSRLASEGSRLLFVLMGGNISCVEADGFSSSPFGMGMYGFLRQLTDEIGRSGARDVDYFLTCHDSDSRVHYGTSAEPGVVRTAAIGDTGNLVETFREAVAAERVVVIGHSYGGWLAMKTVLDVQPVGIAGLYTIDPISREMCSFTRPYGCTTAPADIDTNARLAIAEETGHWTNFFQTETFYLHSEAMGEANANYQINASHTSINETQEVWQHITDDVRANL